MHLEGDSSKPGTPFDVRDLTCPICMSKIDDPSLFFFHLLLFFFKGIAEDPQISSCCHRVFCVKDGNTSRYENGCPLCRQMHYSFQSSAKHREMLEQLTLKCSCSERLIPSEYESHLERCVSVTFVCPHAACREKVNDHLNRKI